MNRTRAWWRRLKRRLGGPGAAGALLLATATAIAWGLRPALAAAERASLHEAAARLDATLPAPMTAQRDPRDTLRDGWPPASQREASVASLEDLASSGRGIREFRLDAQALEQLPPDLLRLRVGMQFSARYADARALVAGVLKTMPNATLDALVIEDPARRDKALHCRLSWSLYFRP
jgi:hypothetical protein